MVIRKDWLKDQSSYPVQLSNLAIIDSLSWHCNACSSLPVHTFSTLNELTKQVCSLLVWNTCIPHMTCALFEYVTYVYIVCIWDVYLVLVHMCTPSPQVNAAETLKLFVPSCVRVITTSLDGNVHACMHAECRIGQTLTWIFVELYIYWRDHKHVGK